MCVFMLALNILCLTLFCVTALYRCECSYIHTYKLTYIWRSLIRIYTLLPPAATHLKPSQQFTDISDTVCAIKNGTFLFMSSVAFLFCIYIYVCLHFCSAADTFMALMTVAGITRFSDPNFAPFICLSTLAISFNTRSFFAYNSSLFVLVYYFSPFVFGFFFFFL